MNTKDTVENLTLELELGTFLTPHETTTMNTKDTVENLILELELGTVRAVLLNLFLQGEFAKLRNYTLGVYDTLVDTGCRPDDQKRVREIRALLREGWT